MIERALGNVRFFSDSWGCISCGEMISPFTFAILCWSVVVTDENEIPTSTLFICFKMIVSEHPLLLRTGGKFSIDERVSHKSST
tara:strand:+ start:19 stop:270 length:252 start_codon:yes stop_codon:yes gene_type:complete